MVMQGDEHMALTRSLRSTPKNATPGFAIKIEDDTELGLAILVAEFGDGKYQPIAGVISINEARETAESDMRDRMKDLERGGTPSCPECYKVWAQGIDGEYRTAATLPA
jgi:hypothetical protein